MAKTNLKSNEIIEKPVNFLPYPIVGIGASAGGLEALQEFFKHMSPEPGVAFVVIQHLSPDYKSFMDELLARCTTIPISVVTNAVHVVKNHIYLIPPKMNMTISEGKLYLNEISDKRFLNLPIDIFFRSLAQDQQKNAIGIILSGTGSDGTLGVRAIKEFGGMTMSQDDKTAKFDGMPRSSISTGMIDYVLPPNELAQELINYVKHPFVNQTKKLESLMDGKKSHLQQIINILNDGKGVDFSLYKENTILRRLEKRISINRFTKIEDYIKFLNSNTREIQILFNELLIGVTRFFRDEATFAKVKSKIIPKIVEQSEGKKEIRIWIAACSTGEEAYTIAMLFREYLSSIKSMKEVKIFATDLDKSSVDFAGTGLYPDNIATDVPADYLSKYFIRKDKGYQINESIRSMIIFAQHNILSDPPFSKLDLISCRNLLIYLNNDVQQKIISTFHICLNSDGHLLLGSSESLGNMADGYQIIDQKSKVYKKISTYKPGYFDTIGSSSPSKTRSDLISSSIYRSGYRTKTSLLERIFEDVMSDFLSPSVIIDNQYNVLHTIQDVSKFLTIPVGQISYSLLKMLPKELSVLVSSMIRRVEKLNTEITMENIEQKQFDKKLSIRCKRLKDSQLEDVFYLISFIEEEKTFKSTRKLEKINLNTQYQERIEELERELQLKSESLQATVEELETSNEELQSSNEELIASNEELQSTNEELQSVNEELYTVNSEHLRKIDELTELNSDFDNLLKNTQIGTLYLDKSICIRKINSVASRLTNILPIDIGRPIHHLSVDNLYRDFIDDIKMVSETLHPIEHEIQDNKGRLYLLRILPYRTIEHAVEGLIILFIEVTALKNAMTNLEKLTERLEYSMNATAMSWWEWDIKQNIVTTGEGKYKMLGYQKYELGDGFEWWTSILHPDDYKKAMNAMLNHLEGKADQYFVEYRIKHKEGHYIWYRDKGKIVSFDEQGKPKLITGIVINIDEEKKLQIEQSSQVFLAKEALEQINAQYKIIFQHTHQGIVFQDAKGEIFDANPAAEFILGVSLNDMKNRTSHSKEWQPKHPDGSLYEGKDHPVMRALRSGEEVKDDIMGVYNPLRMKYVWIKIHAVPIFYQPDTSPHLVYAIFEEIEKP